MSFIKEYFYGMRWMFPLVFPLLAWLVVGALQSIAISIYFL